MPAFHRPNSFARAVAGLVMVPAILLSACGGSSASSGTSGLLSVGGPQPTTQKSIRAEVPASILAEAPLQIATDASYAPNEFVDPNTGDLTGWDLVLATEVCKVLGVACTINNVTFDDIIPALLETPSKYVMSFSSYTPTAEREATGIDFVTYYQAGELWLVRVGGPTITEASQMCGHTVAVEAGTVEELDAWGYMGKQPGGDAIAGDTDHCTSAGLQDITVESFDSQTEANTALLGSRADFGWADQPVADYQVQQEFRQAEDQRSAVQRGPVRGRRREDARHGQGRERRTQLPDPERLLQHHPQEVRRPGRRHRRLGGERQQQQPGGRDLCAVVLRPRSRDPAADPRRSEAVRGTVVGRR